ncbi:MAG TPA: thioredoxin domain-containing protein [Pyrinomonadaceae bacterium]|nr:thioredoxin domain-containing protein [Pyrinomonadaceae bacterium]
MLSRNNLLILACVAAAAFLAACSGTTGNNGNGGPKNTNAAKASGIPASAPPGAQPPTQAGAQTAAVTLEEFADFSCPQCGLKNPIFGEIRSIYGTRIRFIFRHFPLDIQGHEKSYDAAVAAEAAGFQGKFWDMENQLFSNQKTWTSDPNYKTAWKDYASRIGLDVAKWENDCIGIAAKTRVDADKKRAQAIPINSTPTLFINNVEVPFPQMTVDGLKALIDAELAKAAPAAQTAAPAATTANTSTANSAPTNK